MKKNTWIMAVLLCIIICGTISAQTRPVITIGGSYWNAKPTYSGTV